MCWTPTSWRVSPASAWRVLSRAGAAAEVSGKPSKKWTGFEQPPQPHQNWHIDVSYLNVCATFYYLCSILDGYKPFPGSIGSAGADDGGRHLRSFWHGPKSGIPGVKPRIISDNGPQFIAKDFKEFIRISGMTHVRASPYYPQSKNRTLAQITQKGSASAPGTPLSLERCTASG